MQAILKSHGYTAAVDSHGAELSSLKTPDGTEYIWQADPDIWARHAPVLFPFVCSTDSKKFTFDGKEYKMSNHGFARDSEFEKEKGDENSVSFVLRSNDKTKELYPFDFKFTVAYTLNKNKLTAVYSAENTGIDTMYCFIGGHPGFNCPLEKDEDFSDYYVKYEKPETVIQQLSDKKIIVADNTDTVNITRELFANDVFMKDKPNSSDISLFSRKSGRGVKVFYDNNGCIAVWSPYNDKASFVCLEPWTSVPVYCDKTEELTEMSHALKIKSGDRYDFSFAAEIY